MKQRRANRWSRDRLIKYGLPALLLPGVMVAISLGWNPSRLLNSKQYYANSTLFPKTGIGTTIIDGDTFALDNGVEVRLLGMNAPGRGEPGFEQSSDALRSLIAEKRVYVEYDRYQDDKYGRVLAWVWVGCEANPTFLPPDYMHISKNASREGLKENPSGCQSGKLINEEMVLKGFSTPIVYKDRGELKYERRVSNSAQ